MKMNDYQSAAIDFALPSAQNISYLALGLSGEAGEVAEKIKKVLRDNNGIVTPEKRKEITKELGDVMWYVSNLANHLGVPLSLVAQTNIDKLESRQSRGKLRGSGDNR